jgi:hypothetical protein
LFLVAQLTHRWSSRYTVAGKTIWTERLFRRVLITTVSQLRFLAAVAFPRPSRSVPIGHPS